jgi:CBS domain-containing protein
VLRYAPGKAEWLAAGLPSEGERAHEPRIGALARAVPTAALDERVGDIRPRVRASDAEMCVVVNERRVVLGVVRGGALEAPPCVRVSEVMEPAPSTYRPDVSVKEMAEHLRERDVHTVLISTGDGELIGLLERSDLGPILASYEGQED